MKKRLLGYQLPIILAILPFFLSLVFSAPTDPLNLSPLLRRDVSSAVQKSSVVPTPASSDPPSFSTPAPLNVREWTALGDSFASGIGAGKRIPGSADCERWDQAYPKQLNDSVLGQLFNNIACSWSDTNAVLNNQIPSLGNPEFATLTVGGNDVGFKDALENCIYQPLYFARKYDCDKTLNEVDNNINNGAFANHMDNVIKTIIQK